MDPLGGLQVEATEQTHRHHTHQLVGAALQHVAEDVLPQLRALLRDLTDPTAPAHAHAHAPAPTAAPVPPLRRRVRHVRAALLHAAQLLAEEEVEEEDEEQGVTEVQPSPPSLHSPMRSDSAWAGGARTHRRTAEATQVDAALEPMLARYSQLYAERLGAQLMAVLAPHVADTAALHVLS